MTASPENPFAGQGAVLLDIGGDVGALVVTTPAGMDGVEVEIRPENWQDHLGTCQNHGHVHHAHVAVVSRPVGGARVPSLVFPELVEGSYELFEKNASDLLLRVRVHGGTVTSVDWPR